MDFDSGVTNGADGDGQREPLEQRKVHVYVKALSLKTGKAVCNDLELLPRGVEMIEPLLQAKSRRLLGQSSLRRKRENFSYCLRKPFFQ